MKLNLSSEKEKLRRMRIGRTQRKQFKRGERIPWNKGGTLSEITKEKMSKSRMGRIFSTQTRNRISLASKARIDLLDSAATLNRNRQESCDFYLTLRPILEEIGYSREFIIGPYIVDFALSESKTVIEIDWYRHQRSSVIEKDRLRDSYLHRRGWKVIRIRKWLWIKYQQRRKPHVRRKKLD